jgi:5-hydroxyisourate hydrolase
MSTITTHVLDTALGKPASGVSVVLQRVDQGGQPMQIGAGVTDSDGRVKNLLMPSKKLETGDYRLRFATSAYFARDGRESFYPVVVIEFSIAEADAHYHVPLLLSPYGYSTYRGS